MFTIKLKNNKSFKCKEGSTIFNAAKENNILLEHSCLSSRCRSCIAKLNYGKTKDMHKDYILSDDDKKNNLILTCNAIPLSNLNLDIEDIDDLDFNKPKITPCKINEIIFITENIIKLCLRIPPNVNLDFNPGQYINLTRKNITRSYSISNFSNFNSQIELFIKNYKNGKMSDYLFNEAKKDDLMTLEGPLGTFYLRNNKPKKIIFLATGTGIAPIKAMIEFLNFQNEKYSNTKFWLFFGARTIKDLFWKPEFINFKINYVPVISRKNNNWTGEIGYVQDIVLKKAIELTDCEVYACGSYEMINSAKEILTKNGLIENKFFSDAFVQSNNKI